MNITFKFIDEVTVNDPDTGEPTPIEIWKDCQTNGLFGIDATYLDQVGTHYNPFTGEKQDLPEPDVCFSDFKWIVASLSLVDID